MPPIVLDPCRSAVSEAFCTAVVGTSGVVFGMAGLTLADLILNFETLSRPLLRATVLLSLLVFFAVTVGSTPTGTSHMSHVGGFLCGVLPALVLLPNVHRTRGEAVATALGAAGCLAMFIALPLVFYKQQLPQLPQVCCGC
jgi:membrane associated rhomboid family serine protease